MSNQITQRPRLAGVVAALELADDCLATEEQDLSIEEARWHLAKARKILMGTAEKPRFEIPDCESGRAD